MIPLGLRLVLGAGREALVRLLVLAGAVGLGVGMLLTSLAAINGVSAWNESHAWLWTGTSSVPAGPATGVAPLWWHPSGDTFEGRVIDRVDVAATGPSSPVPPGIAADPSPGEYYASPALAALLRSTPANELADRYPGHLAGTIGEAALPSPSSLMLFIGRTPAQLAGMADTTQVTAIATSVPGSFATTANPHGLRFSPPEEGIESSTIDLILSVVALAVLIPILTFIATATRLSSARREERFAAMRLVGASRKQVSLLAAVESTAAAVLGAATGFGIFFVLRGPVAGIPFIGQPLFPGQLSLSALDVLTVAIGVPVAAAVAARLALRRVHISPLGVARHQTPAPPRSWRMLPLGAGIVELGFFAVHGRPGSVNGQVLAFVPGFFLIIVGLVIAGPWLTMAAARAMARRTSRPGALIAARRLADDPRAAFRAVSGLVLALFITTVAVVSLTTQNAKDSTRWGDAAAGGVVMDQLDGGQSGSSQPSQATTAVQPAASAASLAPLTARLQATPGVRGIIVVRADPGLTVAQSVIGPDSFSTAPAPAGAVSCAQLALASGALGHCPAGTQTVAFPQNTSTSGPLSGQDLAAITWPAVNLPASKLDGLAVDGVSVATDGSTSAVEQARTVLENAHAYPAADAPTTLSDMIAQANSANTAYEQLANTIILVSLPIAGCTLVATVIAGLTDRRRPFSLLRLTGARLATLRRVVALESAVPLLAVAAVAIGAGFAASAMYASAQLQRPMVAPGPAYYAITAGGILAALGIIAATFPLLARITGPEVARND